jgi:hypothetical protein
MIQSPPLFSTGVPYAFVPARQSEPRKPLSTLFGNNKPCWCAVRCQRAINIIDGNDLAGIACEPDGEARLIIHDAAQDRWQCEQGPFKAARFKKLPATQWDAAGAIGGSLDS